MAVELQELRSRNYVTIIAAETAGRVSLAMEISPEYCDVAIERWQAMTGGVAVLASNASSFADTASRRPEQATENTCMLRPSRERL
jgi:hypothetical protein